MTTNCIPEPTAHNDNIFSTGTAGWPGVTHLEDHDFYPAIKRSLQLEGFTEDLKAVSISTGYGHRAVLGLTDTIVGAVKSKAIRHFFLVAGSDGNKLKRSYYADFVNKTPMDTVVLTLACGKFRFNQLDLGDIGGIPRLLDSGKNSDLYSSIKIAMALSEALKCGINELPLSFILSWYEQKGVAMLLTLFHLGIKNIRLGPTMPAFLSPKVLKYFVDTYKIMPINAMADAEEDLKAILGKENYMREVKE